MEPTEVVKKLLKKKIDLNKDNSFLTLHAAIIHNNAIDSAIEEIKKTGLLYEKQELSDLAKIIKEAEPTFSFGGDWRLGWEACYTEIKCKLKNHGLWHK